jgi:hypothetical protein
MLKRHRILNSISTLKHIKRRHNIHQHPQNSTSIAQRHEVYRDEPRLDLSYRMVIRNTMEQAQ